MTTTDGKFGISITITPVHYSYLIRFSCFLISLLVPEIPTTDGKLASTSLRIAFFCTVFYCYYLEVVFLASSVAAPVTGVKTTTDRKCFKSIIYIFEIFVFQSNLITVSVLLYIFFFPSLEPETSTTGNKPFNIHLYCYFLL